MRPDDRIQLLILRACGACVCAGKRIGMHSRTRSDRCATTLPSARTASSGQKRPLPSAATCISIDVSVSLAIGVDSSRVHDDCWVMLKAPAGHAWRARRGMRPFVRRCAFLFWGASGAGDQCRDTPTARAAICLSRRVWRRRRLPGHAREIIRHLWAIDCLLSVEEAVWGMGLSPTGSSLFSDH